MQFDFSQISSIDITPIYLFFIISGPDYFRSHNYRLVVLRHVYFATMPLRIVCGYLLCFPTSLQTPQSTNQLFQQRSLLLSGVTCGWSQCEILFVCRLKANLSVNSRHQKKCTVKRFKHNKEKQKRAVCQVFFVPFSHYIEASRIEFHCFFPSEQTKRDTCADFQYTVSHTQFVWHK